jgi:hypothetical protein
VAPKTVAQAAVLANEPPRFAWKAPLTVHVTERATKDSRTATLSYWLDVCPKAPDLVVVTHRDFHFVDLMGKPASNPEFAQALKELAPVMAAIPRFVIDAQGKVTAVEGAADLLARLQAALPDADLRSLKETLETPAAMEAITASATERWQVWVQAWLEYDSHTITAQDVVSPGRVKLERSAQAKDLPDPTGFGAKIAMTVVLQADTEWPAIRPWTASSERTVHASVGSRSETHSETHQYAFDWAAHPDAVPDCSQVPAQ